MKGLGTPLAPHRILLVALATILAGACKSTPSNHLSQMPEVVVTTTAPTPAPVALPQADRSKSGFRMIDRTDEESGFRLPSSAKDPAPAWAAQGLYGGFQVSYAGPGNDFDGSLALASPTDATTPDIVFVPDLDAGEGFGAYLSYRWRNWEMMFVYEQTDHDGDFPGNAVSHDTTITNYDLNFRRYYGVEYAMQPFLLLGIGWSEADIENGTTDQATMTVVQDAGLEDGINLNLGGGLSFYPLPWVSVYGQAMWRFSEYRATDGLAGKLSNGPKVDTDGWNLAVGASIRLLRGRAPN